MATAITIDLMLWYTRKFFVNVSVFGVILRIYLLCSLMKSHIALTVQEISFLLNSLWVA